ncbi:MAG: metallophosphatase domain-containing protein [Elusimicrobiota bacterium]|jgi:Icc-related predicted phosphoesterase
MRFVTVADTHLAELELPEGDVLLHAGDLTFRGSAPEVVSAARWLQSQKQKRKYQHVIVTAGNHDFLFQTEPGLARELLRENGILYLEDSGLTIEGSSILPGELAPGPGRITVYGSPWQPWFNNWAFNLRTIESLKEKWDMIPAGVDILMTHGPPHGILDGVTRFNEDLYPSDESLFTKNLGCEALLEALRRVKPRFHVFGHIHEGYGIVEKNGTTFINASIMDGQYEPARKARVFDIC